MGKWQFVLFLLFFLFLLLLLTFFFGFHCQHFLKPVHFFYYSIFIIIIIGCARFRRRTFHEPNRERANYLDGLNALIQTPIIIPAELKSKGENAHFGQTAYKMHCNNLYIWFGTWQAWVHEKFIFGIFRSLTSFSVLKTLTGSADLKKVSQNMVSFSEPRVNQTLNLRSIKHFRIAWLFLIDVW